VIHMDRMPFVPITAAGQRRILTDFPWTEHSRALHLHIVIVQALVLLKPVFPQSIKILRLLWGMAPYKVVIIRGALDLVQSEKGIR
jgi:hypothetical protein